MDKYRRMLDAIKSEAGIKSFELADGTTYHLPDEQERAIQMVGHSFAAMRCDWNRESRPEPHRFYRALCKAKNRREAVRIFFPEWRETDTQHPNSPYNLWRIVSDGVLEDIAFAPSGEVDGEYKDTTPIPYDPGVRA